jgi:hypothetical protein
LLSPPEKDATAFASKKDAAAPQGGKEYPDWPIRSLYAVEPSEGMRQTWQNGTDKLRQANPDITKAPDGSEKEIVTLNGGFSDLAELKERRRAKGLKAEGWADAVMAAQAWHWAHPKYDEAVVSKASQSGTSFSLLVSARLPRSSNLMANWSSSGTTKSEIPCSSASTIPLTVTLFSRDPPYSQDYRDYELSLENDTPQQRRGLWEAMFDTPAYKEFFDPSLGDGKGERKWFEWKRVVNDQAMIDRTFSKSYVVYRSEEEKKKIKEDMMRFLQEWKGQEWVDKEVRRAIRPKVFACSSSSTAVDRREHIS